MCGVGVPNEEVLLAVAEGVYKGSVSEPGEIRRDAVSVIGEQATADAIAVAAGFNGITRIANATGLPLDESTDQVTEEMRANTGIDRYSESAKARLFDE